MRDQFRLTINGDVVAEGQRQVGRPQQTLKLQAGDGWSPGTCEFASLRLSPPGR